MKGRIKIQKVTLSQFRMNKNVTTLVHNRRRGIGGERTLKVRGDRRRYDNGIYKQNGSQGVMNLINLSNDNYPSNSYIR